MTKEDKDLHKILSYFLHMNCFTYVLDEIKETPLYKYKFKKEVNSITKQVEEFLNKDFKEFHKIVDADMVQKYYNEANDFYDNLAKLSVSDRLTLMEDVNKQLTDDWNKTVEG